MWKALPAELEREITRLDLALPDPAELELVLDGIITSAGLEGHRDLTPALREAALAAAGGLTTLEAENAFALSLIECETISPAIVAREKAQTLRKGGLLEVITSAESLDRMAQPTVVVSPGSEGAAPTRANCLPARLTNPLRPRGFGGLGAKGNSC